MRALDTIEALQPEVVVPGHGPITDLTGLETLRVRILAAVGRLAADLPGRPPAALHPPA